MNYRAYELTQKEIKVCEQKKTHRTITKHFKPFEIGVSDTFKSAVYHSGTVCW